MESQEKKLREELARQGLVANKHMNEMLKLEHVQLLAKFAQEIEDIVKSERRAHAQQLAAPSSKIDELFAITKG